MAKRVHKFPHEIREKQQWELFDIQTGDSQNQVEVEKAIDYWMKTRPGLYRLVGRYGTISGSFLRYAITDPYTALEFKIRWC